MRLPGAVASYYKILDHMAMRGTVLREMEDIMNQTTESTLDTFIRITSDAAAKLYADQYSKASDKKYVFAWARARTKRHYEEMVAKFRERRFSDGLVQCALGPLVVMSCILTDADMRRGEHDPRHATSLTG